MIQRLSKSAKQYRSYFQKMSFCSDPNLGDISAEVCCREKCCMNSWGYFYLIYALLKERPALPRHPLHRESNSEIPSTNIYLYIDIRYSVYLMNTNIISSNSRPDLLSTPRSNFIRRHEKPQLLFSFFFFFHPHHRELLSKKTARYLECTLYLKFHKN